MASEKAKAELHDLPRSGHPVTAEMSQHADAIIHKNDTS
jgi:hypothetical protein